MAGILPPLRAYSFRHLHSAPLQHPFQDTFSAVRTLSYHGNHSRRSVSIRGFGDGLRSPDHFRRNSTRLVSYYALFKGMAASKPTSQLSEQSHILCFSTESILRDLSRRSGFLPSRSRTLSHGSCLPGSGLNQEFGVCLGSVGCEPPSLMQCSTSCSKRLRPYLNMFRREPAISQFDWPFTPIHSSSERFSTHNGSALHSALPELQPGHG